MEWPAGREGLLQGGERLPTAFHARALGAPAFQLGLEHTPVHLEIIDDEDAPPGDLLVRRGRSRCVDRLDGHREPKRRAGAGCAVDSDFAAHEVDELAANGQAEAGTPIAAGRRCVCLTEFLKQRRLSCLRDTNAGVAHAGPPLVILPLADCRYLAMHSS